MSEAWRSLQQSYREVNRLFADVQPPVFTRQEWKGSAYARRSLGDDVQVEVWYLAEHFLLAWNDWWGLCKRYLHYFGQPEERLPLTWRRLAAKCHSLAHRIGRDGSLDEIVSGGWILTPAMSGFVASARGGEEDSRSARTLFHTLVMNHRRLAMLSALEEPVAEVTEEATKLFPDGPVWPQASETVRKLNHWLIEEWNELPSPLRGDTLWYLRNYRRANLAVSWLLDETSQAPNATYSAFIYALRSEKSVLQSIEQFIQMGIEAEDQQTVNRVLRRVQAVIAEIGYDAFVEDVASEDFQSGNDSPVGSDAINVIPGHNKAACCPVLLAVSKGNTKALGFPNIMKQVREHLICCFSKTRTVIVLCDYWHPAMLDDHIGDLRAHHERGVQFLFLMVGTPGRVVAPVAVDLGLIG